MRSTSSLRGGTTNFHTHGRGCRIPISGVVRQTLGVFGRRNTRHLSTIGPATVLAMRELFGSQTASSSWSALPYCPEVLPAISKRRAEIFLGDSSLLGLTRTQQCMVLTTSRQWNVGFVSLAHVSQAT
jgi:hypothetical protein